MTLTFFVILKLRHRTPVDPSPSRGLYTTAALSMEMDVKIARIGIVKTSQGWRSNCNGREVEGKSGGRGGRGKGSGVGGKG